jgi:DNA polymerase (family 10)
MTNAEIAKVFDRIATMLEIEDANPFRVRAYREAARVLEVHGESIAGIAAEPGKLEGLKGIGKDIAQKIRDVVSTGSTAIYQELQSRIPLDVLPITELQGLGPKRVRTLMKELNVRSVADLETAVKAGQLKGLPGFGEKVEQNVLKALSARGESGARMLLADVWDIAHTLQAHLRAIKGVKQVEIAGSFRRRKETIGDLDLVACGGKADAVMEAFVTHPSVAGLLGRGDTKSSVKLGNGLQVDLRHVPEASYGAALLYFTGSKSHAIEIRKIAVAKGWSLNEYGLTEGERVIASRTEEEIYRALGMAWIPPELRESNGEVEQAIAGTLPVLIEPGDLVADLHMHTTRTDGKHSLDQMVEACMKLGYRYIAITEHSKALPMITGFDDARVFESAKEIGALRTRFPGIAILHGLEVDILADGSLDLGEEALAALDWVIVSLHTRLQQPAEEMTKRVLRALAHPAVNVMGHPTTRRFGIREAAAFDLEQVIERAAVRGVAMEINAQPQRTDLSDVNARRARALGVSLTLSTDAHSTQELGYMRYGVFNARRAGLTRGDILNTLPFERFQERLRAGSGAAPKAAKAAQIAKAAPAKVATKPRTVAKPKAGAKPVAKKPVRKR